ncbi:MAG: hypothetical protein KDJ52_01755 [Anaerolineae bacterium]|nr:hypothetical protein [Anaerolineae bacterium]
MSNSNAHKKFMEWLSSQDVTLYDWQKLAVNSIYSLSEKDVCELVSALAEYDKWGDDYTPNEFVHEYGIELNRKQAEIADHITSQKQCTGKTVLINLLYRYVSEEIEGCNDV